MPPAGITTAPRPPHNGLYHPGFEHDACGVGMICDLNNRPGHQLVRDALQILVNLTHRGACGCDETTGDGAGILIRKPHRFLQKATREANVPLPAETDYAAGLVFLPTDRDRRRAAQSALADAAHQKGLVFLGWRAVPVNPEAAGDLARRVMPEIRMLFVGKADPREDAVSFERRLYLMRKSAERRVHRPVDPEGGLFHIASLSSRTLVYKGMLLADQMSAFYPDLCDPEMASALALVHQRYSTNTFPSWDLAQPFRYLCHNGEINTVRGNINWMRAREPLFRDGAFGDGMADLIPVATPGGSDSATLDNALELLLHTGRPLAQCMMMLVPEAWQHHETMSRAKKDFYAYHACLMEPWDGPAAIAFTDGINVGAVLDRNGLRPGRYTVTRDGRVIMASETGVLPVDPADVALKGRLEPGRMFLVDLEQGRIVHDDEIKESMAARRPYGRWMQENLLHLNDLPPAGPPPAPSGDDLNREQQRFGYTAEDLKLILGPMAEKGIEPTGSMGDDIPLAILSRRPRLLYDYFRQLFAQVTNPPLDAIRERLVTALSATIGRERNLFAETPLHCRQLHLAQPILTPEDLAAIRASGHEDLQSADLSICWPLAEGGQGLTRALEALCRHAARQVEAGARLLILSDRDIPEGHAPMPALLATAAVHHGLIDAGMRSECGLIVETGEAREIHHVCCLLGYGAGAVVPWLALATIDRLAETGRLDGTGRHTAREYYTAAVDKGILKVMSKMGISTLQSYRGAQIFECVGLDRSVVDRWFTGTVSRIGGADMDVIAREIEARCRMIDAPAAADPLLTPGGRYRWRRDGEAHQYNPETIPLIQQAVRQDDQAAWQRYCRAVQGLNRQEGLIRGRFDFIPAGTPVPLDEVAPWTDIVRHFKTGAMSYGSISREAHETQAIAMNRIGGRSNSGEGGEDADRFDPDPNGDWRNSAIKQIASGRFGVTIGYLASAVELQIKMAQGAKPGEGGQLPGEKVYPWIARTRHSTPGVGLISPPPHHDIYSIEDLAQLIYDLKCANPRARINVKLVSEVGVGTVAAGVAKAGADVILISGETGGTGASPLTSIRYGGLPWELGLSESQQTLVQNGLRDRVVLECDGQLKTAHDVAVACLLGAQEFGFGTISLVALGCVMMRVCHLNTCPVGIATQDPELRKKFTGRPEHLIRLMRFIAEDLRTIMARLGFRTIAEMAGRVDRLNISPAVAHWKAQGLDLSPILHHPEPPPHIERLCIPGGLMNDADGPPDSDLIRQALPALEGGPPVTIDLAITNVRRTLGTRLSYEIARRHGGLGLPDDSIVIRATGSAGQSFFAFGARGVTVRVKGDANDYFGKGLSGAVLAIRPPDHAAFAAEENIIVGNVALYGATAGRAYIRGRAGERFCVRNSGAKAVVEGVGDHGCEYMTGGRVVVLGPTGRNFAAGMSGGIAYVLEDENGWFRQFGCNRESVDLDPLTDDDATELSGLIQAHAAATGSSVAERLPAHPASLKGQFVKVMPREYKRALARLSPEERSMEG
ncbi:glutamate synthase [Desulfosarcina alkanivorans]|uniref:Glutamate synthase [NADPH] large chain n=1 Tax=Desulfosarcina alkanivorans TaxID=571177 RepID=A0A5K7YMM4_9BACT|nr:glutamate synthase large subunit [Desulfosarcina alkanivorans]BBO70068.1 glutamate synthase [Desulfosarcina alkanivorans]